MKPCCKNQMWVIDATNKNARNRKKRLDHKAIRNIEKKEIENVVIDDMVDETE